MSFQSARATAVPVESVNSSELATHLLSLVGTIPERFGSLADAKAKSKDIDYPGLVKKSQDLTLVIDGLSPGEIRDSECVLLSAMEVVMSAFRSSLDNLRTSAPGCIDNAPDDDLIYLGSFVDTIFLGFYQERRNRPSRTHCNKRDVDIALEFTTGQIPNRFDSTYHALQIFEAIGFPMLTRHLAVLKWFHTCVKSVDDSDGKILGPVSHPIDSVIEKIGELEAVVESFNRCLSTLIGHPMNPDDFGRLNYFRDNVPIDSHLMATLDRIVAESQIEFIDLEIGCATLTLSKPPGIDNVIVDIVTDVSVEDYLRECVKAFYMSSNAKSNSDDVGKVGMSAVDHFSDFFKKVTTGKTFQDKLQIVHDFASAISEYDYQCATTVSNAVYQSCVRAFLGLCNHGDLSDDDIATIGETLLDDDCATHGNNAHFVSVLADALYEADLLSEDRILNYENVEIGFSETNVVSANKKRMQPTHRNSGKGGKHGTARPMRFRDTRVANKPDKDEVVGSVKLTKKPESSEHHKKKAEAKAMRVAKATATMAREKALEKIASEANPTTPVKFEVDQRTAKFSSQQFSRFKDELKEKSEALANKPKMYNVVYDNGTTDVVSEKVVSFHADIIVYSELVEQVVDIDDGSSYGYIVTCDKKGDWWTLFETKNGFHRWSKITSEELANLCDGRVPADIRAGKYLLVFRSAVGYWINRHAQNNKNSNFMTVFNKYIELSPDKIYPADKYTITIFGESVNAWKFTHKKANSSDSYGMPLIPESGDIDDDLDDCNYEDSNPFAFALESLEPKQENIIEVKTDVVVVDSDKVVDVSKPEKIILVKTKKVQKSQLRVNLFCNPDYLDSLQSPEQKIASQQRFHRKKEAISCSACMDQATGCFGCTRSNCDRDSTVLNDATPHERELYVQGDKSTVARIDREVSRRSKLQEYKSVNRNLIKRQQKLRDIVDRLCDIPMRTPILTNRDFPELGSNEESEKKHFHRYPAEFCQFVESFANVARYDKPAQASHQHPCGHEYTIFDRNTHGYVIVHCNKSDCPYLHVGQLCPCPKVIDSENPANNRFPKLLTVCAENFECETCKPRAFSRACVHGCVDTLCVTCKTIAHHQNVVHGRPNGGGRGGGCGGRPNGGGRGGGCGSRPNGGGQYASR